MTHKEKRQSKISFSYECLSAISSGFHPQPMPGDGLHASLCTTDELYSLATYWGDMAVGTIWYHMTPMLKQSKEIYTKSGIGEDISKQTNLSNTGYEGSLFLCEEMFQAQGHSSAALQGATSCMQLLFPESRNLCGGQNGEEMLGKRSSVCNVEE